MILYLLLGAKTYSGRIIVVQQAPQLISPERPCFPVGDPIASDRQLARPLSAGVVHVGAQR